MTHSKWPIETSEPEEETEAERAAMAGVIKALRAELAARKDPYIMARRRLERERNILCRSTGMARMDVDHFVSLRRRVLAQVLGLPEICPARRCRRTHMCCTDETPCVEAHGLSAIARVYAIFDLPFEPETGEQDETDDTPDQAAGSNTAGQRRKLRRRDND